MTGATPGPLDARDCAKNERVLQADWTVWEGGRIVDWGSIPEQDGAIWTARNMFIQVGSFGLEAGRNYIVQLHFTRDGTALNVANPYLIVMPHKDMY